MSGRRRSSTTQSKAGRAAPRSASPPVPDGRDLDVVVAEQFDDRLPLDVVVLDDEQPLDARGREVLDAVEGRLQAGGGGRLDEIGEGAVRQTVLAFLLQRDDLHGDVPRRRVELEVG